MNYELALNSEVQAVELNSRWNNEVGSITFNSSVESAAAIGLSFVLSCTSCSECTLHARSSFFRFFSQTIDSAVWEKSARNPSNWSDLSLLEKYVYEIDVFERKSYRYHRRSTIIAYLRNLLVLGKLLLFAKAVFVLLYATRVKLANGQSDIFL